MSKLFDDNLERAFKVVQEAMAMGVQEFCVCAGSRNAPLIAVLSRIASLKISSFADERTASFFALGRMQDEHRPVAVLCSSGTAVAELLPATIEAFYQKLPLLLITADRPFRYRNTGAPQSMNQAGLLAEHCQFHWDVDCGQELPSFSEYRFSRPVHLNVSFDEPLLGSVPKSLESSMGDYLSEARPRLDTKLVEDFLNTDSLVVLLGSLRSFEISAVKQLLLALKVPVLAEATSCLREDPALQPYLIKSGEFLLNKLPLKRVLRLGGVPSGRFWRNLEDRVSVEVLSLSDAGFSGLARESHSFEVSLCDLAKVTVPDVPRRYDDVFRLDQLYRQQLKLLLGALPLSEVSMLSFLSQRVSDLSDVFLGNSLVIREWNLGARFNVGQKRFFANRGMNGIDGQLSSFLGATATKKALCWGVFGDLTVLYDLNAPWIMKDLGRRRRAFVVVNNGGGQIFSRVKDLNDLWNEKNSRALLECAHDVNFEAWSKMWHLNYVKVKGPDEFHIPDASFVMELCPDSQQSSEFWTRYERLWEAL